MNQEIDLGENKAKRKISLSPKNNKKKSKIKVDFEFGNYNQYYGYRNIAESIDSRVKIFLQRKELFVDKDILDIGCNIGHVTYIIARDLKAKSILGMDIDNSLIKIARKNRRHYCKSEEKSSESSNNASEEGSLQNKSSINQNESLSLEKNKVSEFQHLSGSLVNSTSQFPSNISFIHGNYVLNHDNLLALEEPRYDVILCLSVTKWIQLNWGDDGLKRVFKRIYAQLRPGGVFILEAQPWESYKKKKLNGKLRANCRNIKFYPRMFREYLLSEVGFYKNETLEIPAHPSKGFQRPIEAYYKG